MRAAPWFAFGLALMAAGVNLPHSKTLSARAPGDDGEKALAHATDRLSFNRDVAPVLFAKCAGCHRPGQSGPFSLLGYSDVKKHAREIAEVVARGYMPPWPPEPGYGEFADTRRLSDDQRNVIQKWIGQGLVEGDPADLAPLPRWPQQWQLGEPDLVVTPPSYIIPSDGRDVYWNLVAPIPVFSTKFVRGVELLPGNTRVLHHAFINIDETRQSFRLAQKRNPPGFDGMDLPESAVMPGGQLLTWQPGKRPSMADEGLAWVLKTNTDLVLHMHLHPTGKPESIEPKVGFYFTDQPPRTIPFRIRLVRFDFELPAGESDGVVEQSYVLPVDVEIHRILPHCHYLGKDLQAYALLPDGQKRSLLWIKDWDFNWQGDYRYAQPVALSRGTRLVMHYTYDNSSNNVRNPNSPPRTVHNGPQTTDEMAALALQAVVHSPQERALLSEDYARYFLRLSADSYSFRLHLNPADTEAHVKLGRLLSSQGRTEDAFDHLRIAVQLNPADDRAHYEIGFIHLRQQRWAEAFQEFQTVVRINPEDNQALGNLGYICLATGRTRQARSYFEAALRLDPEDSVARKNLKLLDAVQGSETSQAP
jgi:hypothetical protein